jgi:uncharacterized protein (TIGR02246 family)
MSSTSLAPLRLACVVLSAAALLTAAGMSPAVAAGPTQAQFDALQARVQETQDRQQIEQLFADYGATLDRHDWEAFGRLFTEDAEFGGGAGEPARGRAAIQASLEKAITSNASRLPAPDFHVFFNPSIHVEGDRATAQSKGAYVIPDAHATDGVPGAAHMVFFTVYDDVLVRRGGHWLFQRRTLHSTMPPEASK